MQCTHSVSLTHVVEPLKIITHPQELKDVIEGESAKFTIQASGTEPLKYHWQWKPAESESESEKWLPCPANWSVGATLTVPKVEKLNEGSYRCVVSNLAGEQTSNSAKLGVGKNLKIFSLSMRYLLLVSASVLVVEPPRIISQPQELRDVVEGKSARFSIQATGTEPMNYKWQWKPIEKGSVREEWEPCRAKWCSGATLTISKVEKSNEGNYRCVVCNFAGDQTSNPAELTIGKNATFT